MIQRPQVQRSAPLPQRPPSRAHGGQHGASLPVGGGGGGGGGGMEWGRRDKSGRVSLEYSPNAFSGEARGPKDW